jgi:DNA-binding transcriptional LysR family regulator
MAHNETRFMESAIALSEELNFSRAAQKINRTQSTVTKIIKQLERAVGVQLFERDRKKVRVTDACRAYVEQARISMLYGERAFQAARAVARQADVVQHVGKSPYTDPFLTSTLLSIHLPLFPQLRIDLSSQYSCELVTELLSGFLDLAIATEPPTSPLLTTVKVTEAPFYIAMSKQDQLASLPAVTLNDLANRSWVIFERRLHPPVYDAVMQLAESRGIVPAKLQHVTQPEEAFPFIKASYLAFVVKAGAIRLARNGVTVRPLAEETLTLKTYLVSLADNQSKVTSELVRAFMKKLSNVERASQIPPGLPA